MQSGFQCHGLSLPFLVTILARLRLNTFNALIDAVGRHEGLKSAERTFAKIIEEGLRPDRVTFTMMLG